jgi:hypothetical protein
MAGRLTVGAGLLLAAAGLAGAASAQGPGQFDGQYVGEMTLTGIINGDCTRPPLGSSYPLTIAGGVVRFKYVPRFDTTLVGRVDAKGDFKATAALHHGTATMSGHIRAGFGAVTASIVTPSCEYRFQTK